MIKDLREEMYFGEDSPLICDENGDYTKPVNFRKRFYRILTAADIEIKGLQDCIDKWNEYSFDRKKEIAKLFIKVITITDDEIQIIFK